MAGAFGYVLTTEPSTKSPLQTATLCLSCKNYKTEYKAHNGLPRWTLKTGSI